MERMAGTRAQDSRLWICGGGWTWHVTSSAIRRSQRGLHRSELLCRARETASHSGKPRELRYWYSSAVARAPLPLPVLPPEIRTLFPSFSNVAA